MDIFNTATHIFYVAAVFIPVLALLIFVHEFGHCSVAKKSGVKVNEFGFGFPPRIWGKRVGETIYSINLLPLGGFVNVEGENGEDLVEQGQNQVSRREGIRDNFDPARSFVSKPLHIKLSILYAGVLMNIFLAFVIFSLLQVIGVPTGISDEANDPNAKVLISDVVKGSPAWIAGIKTNDLIKEMRIENNVFYPNKLTQTQKLIKDNAGREITLVILRGKEIKEFNIIPRVNPPPGEGALGIGLLLAGNISYPWYEAPWRGAWITVATTITMISGVAHLLGQLFYEHTLSGDVAGPIGIASLTWQISALGLSHLLYFVAIISLNLAVLNALPLPALDGGRAFILLIEKIRRKNFSLRTMQWVNGIVFALLILFVLLVSIRDIERML